MPDRTRRLCFDCGTRLIGAGVRRKDGRFASGVLYLSHHESDRSGLYANGRRLADIMRGDTAKARLGLSSCGETLERVVLAGKTGR